MSQSHAQPALAGFTLEVDGIDYAKDIIPRLISLSLTEKLGDEADRLELTLSNHDGAMKPIKRGVYASLSLGWMRGSSVSIGLVNKGRFLVDEVEKSGPPDQLRISARSADLTGAFRKRKDRSWTGTTLGAVIADLASDSGLSVQVHADLAGIALPSVEQAAKSNAAFMRDLGARYDAAATVKDGVLLFVPIGSSDNASGEGFGQLTLTRRGGGRWTFTIPDRDDHDGAEAKWHDKDAAKKRTVSSGKGDNPKRIKRSFASEAEAKAASDAEARKQSRGQYRFSHDLALGDPAIEPNRRVTLQGWDSEIDGVNWLVDSATHRLDARQGLATSVELVSVGYLIQHH